MRAARREWLGCRPDRRPESLAVGECGDQSLTLVQDGGRVRWGAEPVIQHLLARCSDRAIDVGEHEFEVEIVPCTRVERIGGAIRAPHRVVIADQLHRIARSRNSIPPPGPSRASRVPPCIHRRDAREREHDQGDDGERKPGECIHPDDRVGGVHARALRGYTAVTWKTCPRTVLGGLSGRRAAAKITVLQVPEGVSPLTASGPRR